MTPVVRVAIDEQNPWPGLGSFDEESERFFNGRQNESAELRRLVLNGPVTVLFGASGLGKTSLAQAGLFPLLRKEHYLPVYVRLDLNARAAALIEQVKFALHTQLETRRVDAPAMRDGESLWSYLHRDGLELWSGQNQLLTPVFVFDQFEEVFTLGAENPAAVARLRIDLADLIENRLPAALADSATIHEAAGEALSLDSQRYKAVLSLREDFLPALEGWKGELPSIQRNRLRLLPMSAKRAFEAVHRTAPNLVDEELAKRIVSFVAAAREDGTGKTTETLGDTTELAVEPALLSLVCSGLNERRKAQGKAVFDVELLAGSGQSIISDYYAKSVGDLPERTQRFVENELITERGFRKPCDIDDARSVHGVTDQELRVLVDRRVLRIEPQRGTERVELTHDLLTRVVREHRDRQRERVRVRRQRRRVAWFGAVGAVLVALVVTFGLLYRNAERQRREADRQRMELQEAQAGMRKASMDAYTKRVEAEKQTKLAEEAAHRADVARGDAVEQLKIATSGRLATAAVLLKDRQLDLASLLGVEADNLADTFDARHALLSTYQSNPDLWTYLSHRSSALSVAFSPDFKTLAVGSQDGTVQLWDVDKRRRLGKPNRGHAGAVRSVAFSPDGVSLASASADGTIGFWDVATRQLSGNPLQFGPKVPETGFFEGVLSLSFSSDGKVLASGNGNGTVELWDVVKREHLGEIPAFQPREAVRSVAFRPRERVLAVGRVGGTELWDVDGRQSLGKLPDGSNMASLAFSSDGKMLAGANLDKVLLWDVEGHRSLIEPLHPIEGSTGSVLSVAFSPDGKLLALGSTDKVVRLWDVASRKYLGEPFKGHPDSVRSVAFSPDGRLLASASGGRAVRLWKISKQFSVDGLHPADPPEDPGTVMTGVAFSPGGKVLATASSNKKVRLWDVASRRFLGELPVDGPEASKPVNRFSLFDGLTSVAFSPDGKLLALATGVLDETVKLFDVATRRALGKSLQDQRSGVVISVAFSPDGKLLASADGTEAVSLWDVPSGLLVRERPKADSRSAVLRVVFSPDGKTLALSHADNTVQLWEVPRLLSIGIPSPIPRPTQPSGSAGLRALFQSESSGACGIAFSPDGKVLASGHEDGTIRLLVVASRLSSGVTLQGHSSPACGVAFSPDGKILASASTDEAVRLWDVASWQPLGEFLKGPTGSGTRKLRFRPDVAFSRDGKILASASADHGLDLWDVDQKEWASRACERSNRNLSHVEWEQYMGKNVPYHRTCPDLPDGEGVPAK